MNLKDVINTSSLSLFEEIFPNGMKNARDISLLEERDTEKERLNYHKRKIICIDSFIDEVD